MYVYQRAIVREFGKTGRWVEADLSQAIVSSIFRDYEGAYIILTHSVIPDPVALDMGDVQYAFGANHVDMTVTDWLASLGNKSLPTSETLPEVNTRYAQYRDAWSANFTIQPVSKTAHWEVDLPKSERPDLRLTREGVDYDFMYRQCMVSVNGLFHLTSQGHDALYVDDGAKSGFLANQNAVGLYQLGMVGDLEFVPITDDMVFKNNENQKLADYAYLHLDRDTSDKTVAIVVGGYFHILDYTLTRTGERVWRLDFNNLPYIERFYQSRNLIDLSVMEDMMERSPNNPDQFLLSELYSDAVIRQYLTLPQSFFVVIDTPDLFVERRELERTQLPGRYIWHNYPVHPLVTSLGLMPEYWSVEEDDHYVIAVNDNLHVKRNFLTHPYKDALTVDPTRSTTTPYDFSRGHFLVVGKDL